MAIAKCGGLVLDGSTLKMVNGIITVASGNPTSGVVANCGGILFDATYFKKVGNVITDKNATSVSVVMVADCGGLMLDAAHFAQCQHRIRLCLPQCIYFPLMLWENIYLPAHFQCFWLCSSGAFLHSPQSYIQCLNSRGAV